KLRPVAVELIEGGADTRAETFPCGRQGYHLVVVRLQGDEAEVGYESRCGGRSERPVAAERIKVQPAQGTLPRTGKRVCRVWARQRRNLRVTLRCTAPPLRCAQVDQGATADGAA